MFAALRRWWNRQPISVAVKPWDPRPSAINDAAFIGRVSAEEIRRRREWEALAENT